LVADIVATAVVFVFSVVFGNSSFYDPYWSIAPIVIAFACLFHYLHLESGEVPMIRQVMVILLTIVWGIRLTWNWAYGWQGLKHEDWRYLNLQQQTGIFWFAVSFLGVHLFPTIIVFLGCLSLYPALISGQADLGWFDALALLITCSAIYVETIADIELHRFRNMRTSNATILTTGVWGWCRHPNYLGEIGFWIGLFIFGFAAQGDFSHYIVAGPVSMILLFTIVSIPMIDKKLINDKPEYAEYSRSTFSLLPFSRWANR